VCITTFLNNTEHRAVLLHQLDFLLEIGAKEQLGYLDIISLADDSDVTLEVTFRTTVDIIGISQHRPLVIELMICTRTHFRKFVLKLK